ncbi:MAG: DUF3108 domain-containing protein [bacterium]
MKKALKFKYTFLSIFLWLFVSISNAQETNSYSPKPANKTYPQFAYLKNGKSEFAKPLREIENKAFKVGEKLEYRIRYGPIMAGNSRLSIPGAVLYNGHPAYKIVSEAWSNSFFSRLYKVQDRVESITDARGIFSWHFKKRLREGSFKQDIEIKYDQVNHLTFVEKDTLQVTPFVLDVLASMYYVRTLDIAPGDTILIDHQDNRKLYPLKIVVHSREKVKIKAGKFNCLVVEPFLREPGLFKQRGSLVIHMTDDHRKIPVKMTSHIYVSKFNLGAVVVELEKMEGVVEE